MSPSHSFIDSSRHPLDAGRAPAWASEWGQDRYGVFAAFTLEAVTQRLRWVPPGRFWMGSPEEETRGLANDDTERAWFEREHPRHEVIITQGFWLFDTPCTQALWQAVMGENPGRNRSSQDSLLQPAVVRNTGQRQVARV
ncbi:SUMF1/EgtB/PvdO family nonheme iron enzyme [uncultured Thiodictyon sp.]|uniref:SUMF1/EgtB/PvdO family nonheme iron enzyme n=1 Tax=uncultured Thiodictyon sp. TaxID=1846217 RepID=UPI0025FDFA49|nr:SUMF1/EgtB/PvdO family nonheme iron enzyme [uncultured Thiodictyon sp.]